MQSALSITTKVLPGNKIEIEIPEAEIGDSVDVFVILPEKAEAKHRSVLDIIEESRKRHLSRTAEDIDRQLQEERLSWGSSTADSIGKRRSHNNLTEESSTTGTLESLSFTL